MTHFFISYSKADTRELALALSEALNAIPGVTAWVDKSLKVGRSWPIQIQTEIDHCDYMIVLYSPDINRHKKGEAESFVLTEINYAKYTASKPIIPIMAQVTDPPILLTMTQYIDFTLKGISLDDLVTAICEEAVVSVPSVQVVTATPFKYNLYDFSDAVSQIIGEPFEWCEVPAGKFLFGDDRQTLDLPGFYIAKYPITYAQFQVFVDARDGIGEDRWWEGLEELYKTPYEQKWKIDIHPRENVNWFQAVAFCRWLSAQLGDAYSLNEAADWLIRLPTEAEWEKAARGTNGRIFPWGNEFDKDKCNTWASVIKQTTPVDKYLQGASPYDALDMSGNVWEWCLTEYDSRESKDIPNANRRVLRGGAWYSDISTARVAARRDTDPADRNNALGFRVSGSVLSS
jgi:formylglycine-generating enzyme required for sulfatase activity